MTTTWLDLEDRIGPPYTDMATLSTMVLYLRMLAQDPECRDAAEARFGGWPTKEQVSVALSKVRSRGVRHGD